MAKIIGCQVYVADPSPQARKLAEEIGYKVYEDVLEMQVDAPELIVDFAGFDSTVAGAIEAVAVNGNIVVVGGGNHSSNISTRSVVIKMLTIKGSNGGTPEDVKGVYDFFATGKLNPQRATIPFEQIDEGLKKLRKHEVKGRLVAIVNPDNQV